MINVRIDGPSRMPLWAALGAPLVGVPMLVGLLALGANENPRPAEETDPVAIEQVGAASAEVGVDTADPVGDVRG